MGRARNGKTDLETTREARESWRRQHGGPGRRIPERFWNQARELARVHGVGDTARALRLNPGRLGAVAGQARAIVTTSVEPQAFVELTGLKVGERDSTAVVELVGPEGDCVRVHMARRS